MTGAFNSLVYLHQKYFYVFVTLYAAVTLYRAGWDNLALVSAAAFAYAFYQVLPHRPLKSES